MVEVPEPPAMEAGLKVTVTPLGCPEADRAIDELKPFEGVAVIVLVPWPPGAMLSFVGFAARVKLAGPVTVRVTLVVSVVLPEVPFTVMGYTPVAVVGATAIFMVEVPVPVIDVGLKVTVTPVGLPLADKVTAELKPPVVVLVMVEVPDLPCTTETALGFAERLKPAAGAPARTSIKAACGLPMPVAKS